MRKVNYDYFAWLVSQVQISNGKTYNGVFEMMHNYEFVWTVPNDDNRVQDGIDLRHEFAGDKASELVLEGATFLEVLIGISRRLAFTAGGDAEYWAWKLMKNLRLHKRYDPLSPYSAAKVNDTLETVVWRTYKPNGLGGFFPLRHPSEDQTKVEIWYQLNAYVIEKESM